MSEIAGGQVIALLLVGTEGHGGRIKDQLVVAEAVLESPEPVAGERVGEEARREVGAEACALSPVQVHVAAERLSGAEFPVAEGAGEGAVLIGGCSHGCWWKTVEGVGYLLHICQ